MAQYVMISLSPTPATQTLEGPVGEVLHGLDDFVRWCEDQYGSMVNTFTVISNEVRSRRRGHSGMETKPEHHLFFLPGRRGSTDEECFEYQFPLRFVCPGGKTSVIFSIQYKKCSV